MSDQPGPPDRTVSPASGAADETRIIARDEATLREKTPVSQSPGSDPGGAAMPADPPAKISPGDVLGHTYEIEALLARGGMGEVYRARHNELGSLHAIKVILPHLTSD